MSARLCLCCDNERKVSSAGTGTSRSTRNTPENSVLGTFNFVLVELPVRTHTRTLPTTTILLLLPLDLCADLPERI